MSFLPPQITGPFPTTGVPTAKGDRPGVRQELRTLRKDDDCWNLFIMGLWALQKVPQYRDLSFYKLAGIHGKPYSPWPPRDEAIAKMQKETIGFCTHTSILFLPWHRPYLALYEQMIHQGMLYVANAATQDEGKSRWLEAAKRWRLPFWDWAKTGLPVFPDEVLDETVRMPLPEAVRVEYAIASKEDLVEIHNPLYSYEFGTDTDPQVLLLGTHQTERYGKARKDESKAYESTTAADRKKGIYAAMSPYSREVNSELRPEGNLRERVVYLIQAYQNFKEVSHNQWDPNRVAKPADKLPFPGATPELFGMGFGSIEDIHNVVHGLVGGMGDYDGHMADVQIASFDPIFWLHHCNIDRICAVWQGLHDDPNNKDTYVVDNKAIETSWATSAGEMQGLDTPLYPFYQDKSGKFWTPQGVRYTANLGYVYPETQDWNFNSTNKYRVDIIERLDALYPNSSLATMMTNVWHDKQSGKDSEAALKQRGKRLRQVQKSGAKKDTAASLAFSAKDPNSNKVNNIKDALPEVQDTDLDQSQMSLKKLATEATYFEFMFNIKAQKHALNGNYGLHVFIGPVEEENVALYTVSPNHVGTFSPLGQKKDTQCGKCQVDMAKGEQITGQIPLTIALVERYFAGFLKDLEEQTVIDHLSQHLHWEIVDEYGNRLTKQRDKVAGLKVSVSSNEVTIPDTYGQVPKYSDTVKFLYAITTGKDGKGRAEGTGMTYEDFYGKPAMQRGEGVVIQGAADAEEGT